MRSRITKCNAALSVWYTCLGNAIWLIINITTCKVSHTNRWLHADVRLLGIAFSYLIILLTSLSIITDLSSVELDIVHTSVHIL